MKGFRKFATICCKIFTDLFRNIGLWFISSARAIAVLLTIILPYVMYVIGKKVDSNYTLLIPLFSLIVIYFLKQLGDRYGKGNTVPVPEKRFTEVSSDGEVSAEYDRLQEMLLYVADVEDYLERKDLL